MKYETEFPDFVGVEMPRIPEGWEDTSWHNDACPSWTVGGLHIFVDHDEPSKRECGSDSKRFTVCDSDDGDVVVHTDDWQEVLACLA